MWQVGAYDLTQRFDETLDCFALRADIQGNVALSTSVSHQAWFPCRPGATARQSWLHVAAMDVCGCGMCGSQMRLWPPLSLRTQTTYATAGKASAQ